MKTGLTPKWGETVVLVHGLWVSGWVMAIQAARLRRCGYDTRLFSYRSMGKGLSVNAAALARFAASLPSHHIHSSIIYL